MMLDSSPVVAVVAVSDLDRGNEFYGGTLGLQEAVMNSIRTARSRIMPLPA